MHQTIRLHLEAVRMRPVFFNRVTGGWRVRGICVDPEHGGNRKQIVGLMISVEKSAVKNQHEGGNKKLDKQNTDSPARWRSQSTVDQHQPE